MASQTHLPDAAPSTPRIRVTCYACGQHHPSMGARINCYEGEIAALRMTNAMLLAEIGRLTRGM